MIPVIFVPLLISTGGNAGVRTTHPDPRFELGLRPGAGHLHAIFAEEVASAAGVTALSEQRI